MKMITPKYLTEQLAEKAIIATLDAVLHGRTLNSMLKRYHFHIVVLVPAMEDARETDYPDYPDYPTKAYVLYEYSHGNKDWEHPYDNIARCKALQLWTDRNDGRTASIPHLLFSGDTSYWGGVKREGIVVACSGVQPWFDRMISGMVADIIIAMSQDAYENDEKKTGKDFLD